MNALIQDLRFGFRMLARKPALTAVAIVALALGIGANTAVFSVVNALLLRPIRYRNPERLVSLYGIDNRQRHVDLKATGRQTIARDDAASSRVGGADGRWR